MLAFLIIRDEIEPVSSKSSGFVSGLFFGFMIVISVLYSSGCCEKNACARYGEQKETGWRQPRRGDKLEVGLYARIL